MRMPADGSAEPTMVSSGEGRTTCSYFMPGDEEVIYSSTHETDQACPPEPDHSMGYVWALYDSYEIYKANADGSKLAKLTDRLGYDAEATVCATDGSILFTSDRDGDIELYRMNADGSDVRRLTHTPGYDGGAFFSADCSKIVWRASRPTGAALEEFRALLADHLVRPNKLELYVANADGTDARQVTYLDAASFGPFLFPSGDRILFSSNYGQEDPREFDIWAIDTDGTDLEQITFSPGFDGFPMFSPDGTRLAFASNRHHKLEGETNMFVAKWIDTAPVVDETAADRFEDAVEFLADDALGGRGVGTDGIATAAQFIEDGFRAAGVSAGFPEGYRQAFEVVTSIERGAASAVVLDGKAIAADAFAPLSFSLSGSVEGAVIDAGYGLAKDYKGKKVKGKLVLVRRFTPPDAKFDDDAAQRRAGDLHTKAITAREQGATGMIVVDTPAGETAEAALPLLGRELGDLGIPAVVVTKAAAESLLKAGKHTAKVTVALTPVKATTENVVGVIPPSGGKAKDDGVIVIGAHYDHLGMGGPDALDQEPGIHNGADDNASGVAALLEIARMLTTTPMSRPVYVIAFSAEEMGDLGSSWFVKHLTGKPVIAMLNLDMVGRMRGNHLEVLGARSALEWDEVIAPICVAERVDCALSGTGYGPSDHMMFYIAGAPVLHFFTGSHLDYHTATDDADKINAGGGAAVARIVAAAARALADRDGALTYQTAPAPESGGDARGWGSSMGTIPTYDEDPNAPPGMILADVVPDGPAHKAGLKAGDRIVEIGTTEVRSVYDLMYVLEHAKPGDVAKVTYVRDDDRITTEVTFAKPRSRR